MLANLGAVAGALGLAPRVLAGFVDAGVNALLGLDVEREASLEVVPLGPPGPAAPESPPASPIAHRVLPLSSAEADYPLLREIHTRSTLDTEGDVRAWRERSSGPAPSPRSPLVPRPAPRPAAGRALGETIRRRGSTRRFSSAPLSAADLATALVAATRSAPADFPSDLVALYVVVNAVEGIAPGAYRYWPGAHGLEPIRAGDFRSTSAHLCLDQPLGGEAAAVLYFLAPLDAILSRWGSRGYRIANLAAGLAGGRAYLAAYGQGFGATGLTFYDGDVVRFFAPASTGLDAIFVVALGHGVRNAGRGGGPLQIR
jgi:nitroreductase